MNHLSLDASRFTDMSFMRVMCKTRNWRALKHS